MLPILCKTPVAIFNFKIQIPVDTKSKFNKKCPKLKGDIPMRLPLLTKLEITKCGQLVSYLPMLPSINELQLKKCDGVVSRSGVHLASLTSLDVSNICKILEL